MEFIPFLWADRRVRWLIGGLKGKQWEKTVKDNGQIERGKTGQVVQTSVFASIHCLVELSSN
jgi:hypothetical protein